MRPLLRRTARLRLTVLFAGLILLTGAGLLAIVGLVAVGSSSSAAAPPAGGVSQAQAEISQLQGEIATQISQAHQAQAHALVFGSAVGLAVIAAVALVLGWFVARWVLRPLRQMAAATRRISADNLHERLAVPGPVDEVKDLADTIDHLLARLEGSFAAQRRFVANASHELRTPLATMRASLDVAQAKPGPVPPQTTELAGRMRAELDLLDRLLEGLLVLARAQHGDLPGRTELSLDAELAAALAARADAIGALGLTVRRDSDPAGAWVLASPALLSQLVGNVLDNAVGHNRRGGWIRVATEVNHSTARLVVENGGEVLDQGQVAGLAQPFRRLGADRTGSRDGAGLGLSIVAAVADAHGGELELTARPDGGLRVAVSLPLAPALALAGRPA